MNALIITPGDVNIKTESFTQWLPSWMHVCMSKCTCIMANDNGCWNIDLPRRCQDNRLLTLPNSLDDDLMAGNGTTAFIVLRNGGFPPVKSWLRNNLLYWIGNNLNNKTVQNCVYKDKLNFRKLLKL